jgi:hypothetical protein
MALATIHVIKKLQLVLSLTSLPLQSTSMQRTQGAKRQMSMQIFSPNMPATL